MPSRELVQLCISRASGSGKIFKFYCMLTEPYNMCGIFQPKYATLLYFYRIWQAMYKFVASLKNRIKLEKQNAVDFEAFFKGAIQVSLSQLSASFSKMEVEQNMLLVAFDDSCGEILQSKFFVNLCTAGRHEKSSSHFSKTQSLLVRKI